MIDRAQLEAALAEAKPAELFAVASELQGKAIVALTRPSPYPSAAHACTEGNISVGEAARRLGISRQWIYRHADRLPFVRKIGRRVLCSTQAVAEWSDRQRR